MYIQNMRIKITALILSLILVLPLSVSLCVPMTAQAASSDLYGTGSADEINIVKLLDMALNRGGMSMSPATIRTFLEFWWSSVQEDLSSCISNVDTSITGTQAFISALGAIIDSPEHSDKLGGILKKYLSFVATMEYKTLSDFKSLLTQQDTFRKFLLSYVVDEEGNIAGTVNNKLKKYRLKSEFVNLTRKAADAYIEEYEGYYLFPTHTYNELSPTMFNTKSGYDMFNSFMRSIELGDTILSVYFKNDVSHIVIITDPNFVLGSGSNVVTDSYMHFGIYNSNWQYTPKLPFGYFDSNYIDAYPDIKGLSNSTLDYYYYEMPSRPLEYRKVLMSADGRDVKVWKSLDAFKQYTAGRSNIYYTKDYGGYDVTADNSLGFTGSYYSSNSSSYSHDIIQNTIDNSSEVNESTVNNIVNNYITNNNYGDGSGSGGGGGSGSGDSGGGWWNIGDGISSFIEGIASLLDFLLKLLGDLVGLLGTFLTSVLEVLSSLAAVGQGFSDFIAAAFKFIPEECTNLLFMSIAGICIAGVVKAFVK